MSTARFTVYALVGTALFLAVLYVYSNRQTLITRVEAMREAAPTGDAA